GYTDLGAAYIFRRSGTTWSFEQKLTLDYITDLTSLSNPYARNNAHFGYSVDIYGDQAIVGAPDDDFNYGAAYIFRRDNSKWYMYYPLARISGAVHLGDRFGYSVAIYHDVAVVGAPFYDSFGTNNGRIYVFKMTAPTAQDAFVEQPNTAYALFGDN